MKPGKRYLGKVLSGNFLNQTQHHYHSFQFTFSCPVYFSASHVNLVIPKLLREWLEHVSSSVISHIIRDFIVNSTDAVHQQCSEVIFKTLFYGVPNILYGILSSVHSVQGA